MSITKNRGQAGEISYDGHKVGLVPFFQISIWTPHQELQTRSVKAVVMTWGWWEVDEMVQFPLMPHQQLQPKSSMDRTTVQFWCTTVRGNQAKWFRIPGWCPAKNSIQGAQSRTESLAVSIHMLEEPQRSLSNHLPPLSPKEVHAFSFKYIYTHTIFLIDGIQTWDVFYD